MSKREPWDFWVLTALRNGPMRLMDIYALIENLPRDGYINPQLYEPDGGSGGRRPKYTHIIRSTMSSLLKRGMVEHRGKGRTGVYRITDGGLKELSRIER